MAEDGDYIDTYGKLTKIFECPSCEFFKKMRGENEAEHTFYDLWYASNREMKRNINVPFSNIFAAQQLASDIPNRSYMNFAILNSLRAWSYFDIDSSIKCFSNVAAFGIDGCTSTLLGESVNTDELCFLVTGDLAFFYDMNVLGIRHIKNNVRILLINNGGGAEFKVMTRSWNYKPNTDPFISANGHNGSAQGWAENCGFLYMKATTKEEFLSQKGKFVAKSSFPILYELFTKAEDEVEAMECLLSSNRVVTSGDKLKSLVKDMLGKTITDTIKNILR